MSKYIDADKLKKMMLPNYEEAKLEKSHILTDGVKWEKVEYIFDYVFFAIDSIAEQPEVDFEEEWEKFEKRVEIYNLSDYPTCYEPKQIARHFYELGRLSNK